MKIEYYEDMLEQEAINRYINMIANDYNGELAKIFQEKYINKDKEIERLNNRVSELEKAVSRKEEEITDLRDEIIDLESAIDEATEYIEKNSYTTIETIDDINYFIVRLDKCADLLSILKGADKE